MLHVTFYTVCTFDELLQLLFSHKWYQLGFHLGLKLEDLALMLMLKHSLEHHLHEILKLKMKSGEELTWGEIVIALLKIEEEEVAQKVERAQDTG